MSHSDEISWNELPEECWEMVIACLNQQHRHRCLESVSLVSKRFLFISNRLRSRLRITSSTILVHRSVSGLLRRFHHLKRIDIDPFYAVDRNQILQEIACSELSLEGLNLSNWSSISFLLEIFGVKMNMNLKILICSRVGNLGDNDLNTIALSFPNLEELDISYCMGDYGELPRDRNTGLHLDVVTDDGIELLAPLQNLRKINISGIYFITDRSLRAISKNFEFLMEIAVVDCGFVSENGITNIIRYKSNLVSLVMGRPAEPVEIDPTSIESSIYAKDLQVLSFSKMTISKELFLSIKEANLPLHKLVITCCDGLTFTTISSLLCKYQSLNHLDLEGARFLTDLQLEHLSMYFRCLSFISLNSCSKLTFATFFNLLKNCSFLEEIQMERTGLGKESWQTDPEKNSRIRSLKFAGNKFLGNKCLKKLVSACTNLVSLDASNCSNITEQGIQEIGKNCSKLSELEVNGCRRVRNIGALGFLNLEVLRARESGINDEGLQMVGKRCAKLLCLDLEGCLQVSDKGVKEVLGSCKRLREVSLKNCGAVSADVVTWMLLSGPTLRKFIPPPDLRYSSEREDLFLRHGCMLYHG